MALSERNAGRTLGRSRLGLSRRSRIRDERLQCSLRALSSVGRAPARQAGGHWFEPSSAHAVQALFGGPFQCPAQFSQSSMRQQCGSKLRERIAGIWTDQGGAALALAISTAGLGVGMGASGCDRSGLLAKSEWGGRRRGRPGGLAARRGARRSLPIRCVQCADNSLTPGDGSAVRWTPRSSRVSRLPSLHPAGS
jgi:hypothetical protein